MRGLGFSSRLSRELGLALPRDAKMTDVPGHTWMLPTLLRHAGVRLPAHRLQRLAAARCRCRRCSGGRARTARGC